MKNRVRDWTFSDASFSLILGPSGWPQGLKRLPKGRPEGFKKGSQMSKKQILKASQHCAVAQGTSGVTQGTPGHQNDIKMK